MTRNRHNSAIRATPPTAPPTTHRAFTLIELLIAAGAGAMLLGALTAALFLTLQAASPADPDTIRLAQANTVLERVLRDLAYTSGVNQLTNTLIDFESLPAGASTPEQLRIAWNGTSGDPLTLSVDGQSPFDLLTDVSRLELIPITRDEIHTYIETDYETSPLYELASFWSWSGYYTELHEFEMINHRNCIAQWIRLPALNDGEKYRLTYVYVGLRRPNPVTGNVSIAIHPTRGMSSYDPADEPLGTPFVIPFSSLSDSMAWAEAVFSDVEFEYVNMNGVCIVVDVSSTGVNARYVYTPSAPSDDTFMRYTQDDGASWLPSVSSSAEYDMRFYLYGEILTPVDTEVTVTDTFLVGLQVGAVIGTGNNACELHTGTFLNQEAHLSTTESRN